jgi:hypothetical protein
MTRYTRISSISALLLILSIAGVLFAQENSKEVDWKAFSKNLVNALQSDNTGLQQSAMQMIIRYGDKLNVKDGLFKVVHIYRRDQDRRVRLLALGAIAQMNSNWAMFFVKRGIKFESDPVIIKHATAYVLAHQNKSKKGSKSDYAFTAF